jgi:alpha-1,2-mannosyltransferase
MPPDGVLNRWKDRLDRILTWKRARTYALVVVGLLVVAWVNVLALGSPPLNASGAPMSGDFVAFHSAGRFVLSGRAPQLYEHAAVSEVQQALVEGRIPNLYDAYRNPPFFAALFAPLAPLDLIPAFAVYSLLSLACLGLALYLLVQEVPWLRPRWRGLVVLVLAFPPVYFGLIDGENATISLLLYVLIYRSLARGQDRAAGAWAALGLFKPQLFFVFPLVFLISRRWRALSAYTLVALALLGVSLLMVGPDGLTAWLRILLEPESANARANAWRMASLKSFFDLLVPSNSLLSLGLYALTSLALLIPLLGAWSRSVACLPALWAWTSLVAVLLDPHLVDYDLTVLVATAVIATRSAPQVRWPIVLVYLVTLFRAQLPISDASVQFTVPLLVLCVLLVARALGDASHRSVPLERVPSTVAAEAVSASVG